MLRKPNGRVRALVVGDVRLVGRALAQHLAPHLREACLPHQFGQSPSAGRCAAGPCSRGCRQAQPPRHLPRARQGAPLPAGGRQVRCRGCPIASAFGTPASRSSACPPPPDHHQRLGSALVRPLAVAAQRAYAASLLKLPPAAELSEGTEPDLHEVLADARWLEEVPASRLPPTLALWRPERTLFW